MKKLFVLIFLLPNVLFAQNDGNWILHAKSLDNYHAPTLANGMIGLKPSKTPLQVDQIVLNGVFDKFGSDNVQCILPGINFADIEIATPGSSTFKLEDISNWSQKLNMKEGYLTTQFTLGDDVNINYTLCALRHLPFSSLSEIEIVALQDVELTITNKHHIDNPLKEPQNHFKLFKRDHAKIPVLTTWATSPEDKHLIAASSGFIFQDSELVVKNKEWSVDYAQQFFTLSLKKGEKISFSMVGSIVSTADFQDPQTEAERQCIFAMLEGRHKLKENHIKAWEDIWATDIVIDGDDQSQQDIRFALFNLYSFVRENTSYSIPPMGLSNLDYYGHIFWDSELWMYPPILVMNPEMAKSMIDYRIEHIESARRKAFSYGYMGIMFPWESDDLGEESTPTWALTGPFEHHITAVVGIAMWNYYATTQDKIWLRKTGYPVLAEIANFWLSRSTRDTEGKYHILNVVGADEYAENVDNNAFTNGAVITVMNQAIKAAQILELSPDPLWEDLANNLLIEKFDDGIIKNYKGYTGQQTKQADVNLLTYPLGIVTDQELMLQNLEYYLEKVDPKGPAMTHSIYSVIYSRLSMKEQAWEMFKNSYRKNQRPPYGVLAEGAFDNNPYFATAAGGMLQAVLFGFCGIKVNDEGIVMEDPQLPDHWKSVTLKGFGKKKETIVIKNKN